MSITPNPGINVNYDIWLSAKETGYMQIIGDGDVQDFIANKTSNAIDAGVVLGKWSGVKFDKPKEFYFNNQSQQIVFNDDGTFYITTMLEPYAHVSAPTGRLIKAAN